MIYLYIALAIAGYLAVGVAYGALWAVRDAKDSRLQPDLMYLSVPVFLWPVGMLMEGAGRLALYLGDKCIERREK